jgi:methionyl-tRNA formyltransferase
MNSRGRIVFMGTPQFAVAPLRRLIEEGFDIAAVVTVPDKPSGRGLVPTPSDVKIYAESCSIPVLQPVSLKDPHFLESLDSFRANLFIVVAFRMLPKEVWSIPSLGTFNLHASLLPDYRGAAPINWALINGETKTGVTTFLIDEKIDTGAILYREECEISEEDNAEALHDRLMNIGGELVVKTAYALLKGEIKAVAQAEKENEIIHPAPKLTKETGRIDWSKNPREIHNLVRGLSPYPAAHTILTNGEKELALKIFSTRHDSFDSNTEYGKITGITKNSFHVACKGGSVEILEVQLPGKKRVTSREFLAGFRNPESFKFI